MHGKKSTNWIPLEELKRSNPAEVVEYEKSRNTYKEVTFHWWVPYVLKKRQVIMSQVTSRIRRTSNKRWIEIPTSLKHAAKIDRKNGNTFWRDAIAKEMSSICAAFDILETGQVAPIGHRKTSGHIIFDVKMDFARKSSWVLDGHKQASPEGST